MYWILKNLIFKNENFWYTNEKKIHTIYTPPWDAQKKHQRSCKHIVSVYRFLFPDSFFFDWPGLQFSCFQLIYHQQIRKFVKGLFAWYCVCWGQISFYVSETSWHDNLCYNAFLICVCVNVGIFDLPWQFNLFYYRSSLYIYPLWKFINFLMKK